MAHAWCWGCVAAATKRIEEDLKAKRDVQIEVESYVSQYIYEPRPLPISDVALPPVLNATHIVEPLVRMDVSQPA